jgi:hypothetical protein
MRSKRYEPNTVTDLPCFSKTAEAARLSCRYSLDIVYIGFTVPREFKQKIQSIH